MTTTPCDVRDIPTVRCACCRAVLLITRAVEFSPSLHTCESTRCQDVARLMQVEEKQEAVSS